VQTPSLVVQLAGIPFAAGAVCAVEDGAGSAAAVSVGAAPFEACVVVDVGAGVDPPQAARTISAILLITMTVSKTETQ
jgi:hypothetical protein